MSFSIPFTSEELEESRKDDGEIFHPTICCGCGQLDVRLFEVRRGEHYCAECIVDDYCDILDGI